MYGNKSQGGLLQGYLLLLLFMCLLPFNHAKSPPSCSWHYLLPATPAVVSQEKSHFFQSLGSIRPYCWWFRNPKQPPFGWCKNLVNSGINYQPQLVQDFFHQQYEWNWANCPVILKAEISGHFCRGDSRILKPPFGVTNRQVGSSLFWP